MAHNSARPQLCGSQFVQSACNLAFRRRALWCGGWADSGGDSTPRHGVHGCPALDAGQTQPHPETAAWGGDRAHPAPICETMRHPQQGLRTDLGVEARLTQRSQPIGSPVCGRYFNVVVGYVGRSASVSMDIEWVPASGGGAWGWSAGVACNAAGGLG
jgi:hypothetical protein